MMILLFEFIKALIIFFLSLLFFKKNFIKYQIHKVYSTIVSFPILVIEAKVTKNNTSFLK